MNISNHKKKKELQKSLATLWDIYQDISNTATEISKSRCPYKNAADQCTARFGCRNQKIITSSKNSDQTLPICMGSDKLDYRDAWEN
jgi:hypothetical protein